MSHTHLTFEPFFFVLFFPFLFTISISSSLEAALVVMVTELGSGRSSNWSGVAVEDCFLFLAEDI